jgi:PhnB protein
MNMPKMNIYLNFDGNTEEAFRFYKGVFGGDFSTFQRFKDTPQAPQKLSKEESEMMMHVALPLGDNTLMGTDTLASQGHKLTKGNNFSISIDADSKEKADSMFKGLSKGGKVDMPMQKTFWDSYFGMCTDKYGVQWMVSAAVPKK